MKRLVAATSFAVLAALLPQTASADALFPRGLPSADYQARECVPGVVRCVWDGKHGNAKAGEGHALRNGKSYILTRYRDGFMAKPIKHRRAHRLIAAYCARPSVACGYRD